MKLLIWGLNQHENLWLFPLFQENYQEETGTIHSLLKNIQNKPFCGGDQIEEANK
jgi:hypothetical protein